MRTSYRTLAVTTLLVVATAAPVSGQAGRAMTFEDFAAMRAVGDPQLSPDGRQLLYVLRTTDVAGNRRIGRTMLASIDGGTERQWPDDTTRVSEARWSADGRWIAYVAGGQLWVSDVAGTSRRRLTSLHGGATGPVWSPTGNLIAFTSAVYPDCRTDACNVSRDSTRTNSPVQAHIADELMFRHWNAWSTGQRSHLFVVALDGGGVRDLTEGATYDVPPPPFGGSEAYRFSPDGEEIAFTAKIAGRESAWSTDLNVHVMRVAGGAPTTITAANRGADQNPVYSPDGRWIAYVSQERAGFESDRWRLMVYDRATRQARELLAGFDRNVDVFHFTPDMRSLYVETIDRGRHKLFHSSLADGRASRPVVVIGEGNNSAFSLAPSARSAAWLRDRADRPAEVWVTTSLGADPARVAARQLTHHNDEALRALSLNAAEEMWYRGAGGDSIQAFVIKPPNFQPGRKYPVVLLVHGGPQGAWLDQWHGRWNYQMFAAPGHALVIPNPRGSIGYGQKLVDEVTRDWGGKAYDDLMLGLNAALRQYAWMDSSRVGAAGGSYGGYMVNWMAGQSNRFKAFVSHAGPFNLENMATATEELWFTEWEYGGSIWEPRAMSEQFRRWSPHLHAGKMNTPTLVTGGMLDFRVPYTESLSLFTVLRRRNVPSRLVIFPDEGHWVQKPQNQRVWWSEVNGWLSRYLASGTPVM